MSPRIATVGFALAWVALAAWRPDTTWHLAPAVVAAAPLVGPHGARSRAGFGLVLAVAVAVGLSGLGWMRGPSLLPVGGPLLEAVVVAAAGTVVGSALARRI